MRSKNISISNWVLASLLAAVASGCGVGDRNTPSAQVDGDPRISPGAHPAVDLNDTGVRFYVNYENFDTNSKAVPTVYQTFVTGLPAGQDAALGRDADAKQTNTDGKNGFSFKKVDARTGAELPSTALDFGCVEDMVTGLTWENKALKGLHASDDLFTWYNPDAATNGGDAGERFDATQCPKTNNPDLRGGSIIVGDTKSFIEQVNNERLCGRSDWRLPTVEELRSITDYDAELDTSMVDINFFPHLHRTTHRWTSQTDVANPKAAWGYHISEGYAHPHSKACAVGTGFTNGIILVRGTPTY